MSDDVSLGLVVAGVALMAAAILWWYIKRNRARRRLVRGLHATDPQERARAGIQLVGIGLLRAARPLLDHVVGEQDRRVRLAIALAVARRQWEPSNANRVRHIRSWASAELEEQGQPIRDFGPALTRISDMGGPRIDDPRASPAADGPDGGAPPEVETPIQWHPSGPP